MSNNRFKFRVYLPDENRYLHNTDCPIIDHDGKLDWCYLNPFGHWEHHPMDNAVIEQCTGVTDKNGKLIYEGDVVVGSWNTKLIVFWDAISASYMVKPLDICGLCREMHYYSNMDGTLYYNVEIIGNIHEMESEND